MLLSLVSLAIHNIEIFTFSIFVVLNALLHQEHSQTLILLGNEKNKDLVRQDMVLYCYILKKTLCVLPPATVLSCNNDQAKFENKKEIVNLRGDLSL